MYTGNTHVGYRCRSKLAVYPCVYREHWRWADNNQRLYRFIPVYTGNTPRFCRCGYLYPVYPCVYREHDIESLNMHDKAGLSLCIQGTPFKCSSAALAERFIPVYTGNTGIAQTTTCDHAVYPCVYREHIIRLEN